MNRTHLFTVVFLLIVLVVLNYYGPFYENFADAAGGTTVLIAKAEWCGHCKAAAPEFKRLVDASPITLKSGKKVTVKMLDADKDKAEINALPTKIRGYPTILILTGGGAEAKEYPGDRTYDGVVDYLNTTGA